MDTDGFDIVPVAIGAYAQHPPVDADGEAATIAELLTEHLLAAVVPADPGEQTEARVKEQLTAWAGRGGRSSVLLWIGHGTSNLYGAWLATHETPPEIANSGVNPSALADLILKQWHRRAPHEGVWHATFIEACGAADFARKLAALLLAAPEAPTRYAVIGVGAAQGATELGLLSAVLRDALAKTYTDNDGPHVAVRELISNVENRLDNGTVVQHGLHSAAPIHRRTLLTTTVTAPIDVYDELRAFLADLPPDERDHFLSKAHGAEQGELAWYFVGRHAELRRIADWLRTHEAGMLIVTGPAGSGKSALLGNLLLRSNRALHNVLVRAGQLEQVAAADLPPPDPFDAVVQLTGFTVGSLVTRLAAATGVLLPAGGATASDAERLLAALRLRQRPLTLLVDALDEAQDPLAIAGALLRRLADLPRVRVIVGTRQSTQEGPDLPSPTGHDLLDALTGTGRADLLRVDRDAAAVEVYVRKRLDAAVRTGKLPVTTDVGDVAALISHQDRQFLFARLAVHELLARPGLLARRGELTTLLSGDHRSLFAAAVNRLAERSAAVVPLLRALALARGRGVPRQGRTWVIVAQALAPDVTLTEQDVDRLRDDAAPYIMLDAEDGQSVYRLAHRTFQEHFRAY